MLKIQPITQQAKEFLSRNVVFILTIILFLPDYLFYPASVVAGIFVMYEFIHYKGYKKRMFWILWAYLLIVAFLNKNTMGIMATFYLIVLAAYAFTIHRRMSPGSYMKLQYYIVWSSLFNFFFNFITWRPSWANTILAPFNQFIQMQHLPPYGQQGYMRAYSTFDNPNLYAFVLLIVLLVCFNQIQFQLTFKRYSQVLFYSGASIVNFYALLLTGTRSIIPAVIIGYIAIVLIQKKWFQLKMILLFGACLFLVILMKPDIFPRFLEISEHSGIRFSIWETALNQIQKEPLFGKGFFTYALLFDNSDAHNLFIESLLSLGLVGTCLLAAYGIEKITYFYNHAYYLDYPLALALVASTLVYGIFDIPLFAIQTSLLFVAILCVPIRDEIPEIAF